MQQTELFYAKTFLRYLKNNGKNKFQIVAEI